MNRFFVLSLTAFLPEFTPCKFRIAGFQALLTNSPSLLVVLGKFLLIFATYIFYLTFTPMDQAFDLLKHLINPQWILEHGGLWLLLFIIFAETGLFIGFFFPGDSLLFVTGMMLSINNHISGFNVWEVIVMVIIAGVLGNFTGYWFGKKSGPLLFRREDSLLFKKKHLVAASDFYKKYGAGAIVFARFLPFIRTFAPIVAGIVKMEFKKFSLFNMIGCIAWVGFMMLAGFFLGKAIPGLEEHLEWIVLGIVVVTTGPILYKLIFNTKKESKAPVASDSTK